MLQWTQLFWDICLLRKTPQNLPYSLALLWILLPIAFILDCLTTQVQNPAAGFGQVLLAVMTLTLLYLLVVVSLLVLLGLGTRIVQTLSSLLGAGMILNLLALPLLFSFDPQQPGVEVWLSLLLLLWNLVVNTHILRAAMSRGFFLSAALAVALYLLQMQIYVQFFPLS